jgi:hypothetical protein
MPTEPGDVDAVVLSRLDEHLTRRRLHIPAIDLDGHQLF